MRTCTLGRPFPEFHHLSHGSSHATGIDIAAAAFWVFGALAVIGEILIPDGLAKRSYHRTGLTASVEAACLAHRLPFSCDVGCGRKVMLTHILDFLAEAIEGELEAFRNIVRIILACGRVGEDGLHAVVASHDDKAFVAVDVEDIKVSATTLQVSGYRDQVQLDVSVFLTNSGGAQEFGTEFLGLLLVNRASHQATDDSEEAQG